MIQSASVNQTQLEKLPSPATKIPHIYELP